MPADVPAPGGDRPSAPVDPFDYALDEQAYRRAGRAWLDELDDRAVPAGPPFARMGVRTIGEADWLLPDEHRAAELDLRRRLVAEAPGEVFAVRPGTGAAAAEAAELVAEWPATHRPGLAAARPGPFPAAASHPLVAAGLGVQEDLCLMTQDGGRWRLGAALVCFPTYWRLADKIGLVQEDVHGPVPHFAEELAGTVTRFFDRLPPGRIVARRNWGFTGHPLLFVPDLDRVASRASYDPDRLWLRSERQTVRRMPVTGAVLFTIRVQLAPASAVAERPQLARRLLDAMQAWSPELIAGRGGRHGWVDEVRRWLATVAAPARGIDPGPDRTR